MFNRRMFYFAVNHNHKESAEDREALGLNGSQGLKKEHSGSNHDTETFQGQINVSSFWLCLPFIFLLATQSSSMSIWMNASPLASTLSNLQCFDLDS